MRAPAWPACDTQMINAHVPGAGATNNSKNCALYILSTCDTPEQLPPHQSDAPDAFPTCEDALARAGAGGCGGAGISRAEVGVRGGVGRASGVRELTMSRMGGGMRLFLRVYNDDSHVQGLC